MENHLRQFGHERRGPTQKNSDNAPVKRKKGDKNRQDGRLLRSTQGTWNNMSL